MENGALSKRMHEKKSCSKVKSILIFVYSFISKARLMIIRRRQKSGLIGNEEKKECKNDDKRLQKNRKNLRR